MSQTTADDLMDVLEAQQRLLEDMAALSKKKTEALVTGRVDELEVLLRGEQTFIWQMGRLEERRLALHGECAAQLGLPPDELTLEEMVMRSSPDRQSRLEAVAHGFEAVMGELSEANELNKELVQQAIGYVDFSMQLLTTGGSATRQIYSQRGDLGPIDLKVRRLDNRL